MWIIGDCHLIWGIPIDESPVDGSVLKYNQAAAKYDWLDLVGTYAPIAKGVTNGDSHDHSGGDGAQINHTTLSNIGTNTHAQLDTFVSSKGAASGLASLNASQKVVEDPANATATPTASKIPIADSSGKLNNWVVPTDVVGGWLKHVNNTSLIWSFSDSNQIVLHDGEKEALVELSSEPSKAYNGTDINGDALVVDKIYDVFLHYLSSTSAELSLALWTTVTAGTSARYGAWATSQAYKIGKRVSNGTHYYACIHAHTSSSSNEPGVGANWQDEWLDNGTDLGADYRGLGKNDGRWVYGGHSTGANHFDGRQYRWVGVIYTYNNSGTVNFWDTENYRYIDNFYNRKTKVVEAKNTDPSNWSTTATSWQEFHGGSYMQRGYFVSCISRMNSYSATVSSYGNTTGGGYFGIGVNSTTGTSDPHIYHAVNMDVQSGLVITVFTSAGLNYVTLLEKVSGGTSYIRAKENHRLVGII